MVFFPNVRTPSNSNIPILEKNSEILDKLVCLKNTNGTLGTCLYQTFFVLQWGLGKSYIFFEQLVGQKSFFFGAALGIGEKWSFFGTTWKAWIFFGDLLVMRVLIFFSSEPLVSTLEFTPDINWLIDHVVIISVKNYYYISQSINGVFLEIPRGLVWFVKTTCTYRTPH